MTPVVQLVVPIGLAGATATATATATPLPSMQQFVVPEGIEGGMQLQVPSPAGMMQVTVPAGLTVGDVFQISMPTPVQAVPVEAVVVNQPTEQQGEQETPAFVVTGVAVPSNVIVVPAPYVPQQRLGPQRQPGELLCGQNGYIHRRWREAPSNQRLAIVCIIGTFFGALLILGNTFDLFDCEDGDCE